MPYIKQHHRDHLDESIDIIIDSIDENHALDDREGVCNYVITRIVVGSLKPVTGWRYKALNRAHGTFMSAAAEFYRRLVAPYEDKCIKQNGDITDYE